MRIVDTEWKSVFNPKMQKETRREGGLLADKAFTFIRKGIEDDKIVAGSRLNEQEIAQQLGISRGPVREAIRRLTSSGIAVYEQNAGARVASLDEDDVVQLFEVREALESRAASLAARHMSKEERKALLAMLAAHEKRMADSDTTSYPRGGADWDFHLMILKACRNEIIWRVCGDELHDLFLLLRNRNAANPARGPRALHEHRRIAEAIADGNAEPAALLMAQHLRASRETLLYSMNKNANAQKSR